jgi:ATP-dependent DNA ligase
LEGIRANPDALSGLVRCGHGNSVRNVNLPVNPPMLPMLAKRIDELPAGQTWIFEPKWDGFRALIFRDRDEILIQSRDAKSLNRYFPELLEPLNAQLPARCVLDGEITLSQRTMGSTSRNCSFGFIQPPRG